ncbi:MAG: hypothetical protein GTN76_00455, partial [Candidatus Aenigmarchaeota archaeon]|nr:hypothetical protein [Candidatus Aenigmarchaeota archaeon]
MNNTWKSIWSKNDLSTTMKAFRIGSGSIILRTSLTCVLFSQLIACSTLLITISPYCAEASTVNVEVGSSVYEDLEFLSSVGLLDTAMIGTLPLSREEVARLVVEARIKA